MKNKILISLFLCLSIGLAPFKPEPHIWQKLKWIADGGIGMQAMDYFDTLLHGFPWVLFVYFLVQSIYLRLKSN